MNARVQNTLLVLLLIAFSAFLGAAVSTAFALDEGREFGNMRVQNQARNPATAESIANGVVANNLTADLIQMNGSLTCTMLEARNNGQGCTLRLTDSSTGRIFTLINAAAARKLYQAGNQKVAIVGQLGENDTLNVSTVRAL